MKDKISRKLVTLSLLAASILVSFLLFSGCGDGLVQGNGDVTIEYLVSTPTSEVNKGSTAIVEVKVTDPNGNPTVGKSVTFSATPSALGFFTPVTANTDQDGTAGSVFTATSAGTVTLQASVEGVNRTKSLLIKEEGSSTGRVTIEVTPLILLANGSDSADILITAVDHQGNPVEDGTILYLTAGERFLDRNKDGYWSPYVDSLLFDANGNDNWDPIGSIPQTVTTTNGTAEVTYRSGNLATTVYIRATMIDGSDVEYAEVAAKLNPNTQVASITLTHNLEDLRVRGVGGIEWTIVTATAYDQFGNAVPEGIPIDFTIALGPGGGENIQNEGYGPVTVGTNQQGQALATVYSGTVSGTIRLRASSGSVLSAVTQLIINAGPPAHLSVGVEQCNVRGWDRVNEPNKVTTNVVDIWGNPVPDSTVIWFSTEEGLVTAHSLTGVGAPKGLAESMWYSGNPKNDGIVYLYACSDGQNVCDTVAFISSGMAAYVNVLQWPASLIADGEDKGKVVIEVLDVNHNFMVQGTAVKFEVDFGTLNGGGTVDGCHFSMFEADYVSEVLKRDYSPVHPDDGIGAISYVSVTGGGTGGPAGYFTTLFLTGGTYVKNSNIDIEAEIEPGSTVPFSVTVKDRSGNPLGGHELEINVTIGTVNGSNFITSQYGDINVFYTAPPAVGTCIMTVNDTDPRGQVSFAKKIKIKYDET